MKSLPQSQQEIRLQELYTALRAMNFDENGNALDRETADKISNEIDEIESSL
jgi:hypothetical protein